MLAGGVTTFLVVVVRLLIGKKVLAYIALLALRVKFHEMSASYFDRGDRILGPRIGHQVDKLVRQARRWRGPLIIGMIHGGDGEM